jgi:REP element-mobilizing transposase RayT
MGLSSCYEQRLNSPSIVAYLYWRRCQTLAERAPSTERQLSFLVLWIAGFYVWHLPVLYTKAH